MFREIEGCMKRSMSSSRKSGVNENLGIESYGISVTTLEEVFLRVAGCDYDEAETATEQNISVSTDHNLSQASRGSTMKMTLHNKVCGNYKKAMWILPALIGKACSVFITGIFRVLNFLSMQCCCCSIISRSIFWQHCKALFIKRAISARRDRKTIVFQLLIPVVFLFLGLLLLKLKPHPDQMSVTFTTSHFNPLLRGGGGGGPIPFDLSWPIANEVCKIHMTFCYAWF